VLKSLIEKEVRVFITRYEINAHAANAAWAEFIYGQLITPHSKYDFYTFS
jgi:hypothetical protein